MSHQLTFTTDSIDVCIKNYEPYSFEYDGWTVSDKYVHNDKNNRGSYYNIVITSPSFYKEEMLNNYVIIGQDIINLITPLIPVCGIPSLNYPKFRNFLKDQNIIDPKSSPQGWSSDYNNVLEQIKAEKGEKIHVSYEFMGICRFSTINNTPLKDLHLMLDKYDNLPEDVRFLLFLNYSILTSDNFNVFMLIGKALEIINAMYPFFGLLLSIYYIFINNYKILCSLFFITISLSSYFCHKYLLETPRWLLSQKRYDELIKVFESISRINNRQIEFDNFLKNNKHIFKDQEEINQKKFNENKKSYTFFEILKFKSQRKQMM